MRWLPSRLPGARRVRLMSDGAARGIWFADVDTEITDSFRWQPVLMDVDAVVLASLSIWFPSEAECVEWIDAYLVGAVREGQGLMSDGLAINYVCSHGRPDHIELIQQIAVALHGRRMPARSDPPEVVFNELLAEISALASSHRYSGNPRPVSS